MNLTPAEIQEMYAVFQRTARYEDRIRLYDQYFNILPFTLPAFDINLSNFFSDKNLARFDAILRQERTLSVTLKKVFQFDKEQFTFNIKPVSANYLALNIYLINRFLQTREPLFAGIKKGDDHLSTEKLLSAAREMIAALEKQTTLDTRKNTIAQYARVFFKGLTDFNTLKALSTSGRRKKIIELYMYAMGFLYGEYISTLQFHQGKEAKGNGSAGAEEKLRLLQEFGFIEAIRNRFPFLNKQDLDRKITDIIYRVTGEKIAAYNPGKTTPEEIRISIHDLKISL